MAYYIPTETGVSDLALDALSDLLVETLQTEIPNLDITKVTTFKVGYRQQKPTGVNILIYENDPDSPKDWSHRPLRFKTQRTTGGLIGDTYSDTEKLRTTSGRALIGGGSLFSRAFTAEIEVSGRMLPREEGVVYTQREVGQIASVVENRLAKTLLEAGPGIGTGVAVADSYGETIIDGPFMGESWMDQQEGKALIVRKYVRFWYKTSKGWTTAGW